MRRQQARHWLRENARETTPHRVLAFDTETDLASPDDVSRQVLRLWSAKLTRRHGNQPKAPRTEWRRGTTAADLAATVDELARSDATLWVFAHNLAFDLAVTELPVQLAARGWRVTEAALTTDQPWCRLSRGSRRITIADTWSWFPTGVAELGKLVDITKPDLPDWGGTAEEWQARCDADVAIISDAITGAMDWWDANRLGNWSITGPACGWSTYRHRRPAPHVLVDPDPAARAFEMAAVLGGRREVRRLGEQPAGLYADLDMTTAHLTAMTGLRLPYRRLRHFDELPTDDRALRSDLTDVLALATVRTDAPRYPWDSGAGVFYPVGTFRALLAGPELREARARGELLAIGEGWEYLTSPHMADWALWIASLLDAATPGVPPQVRLLAKHWSRCVPGKWAGHSSEVVSRTPDPRAGWAVERAVLMPGRREADLLRIGGEQWTIVRDEWADDAFPAILAWIQSATRVALGRLIDMLGPAMVTCNTDGLVVDVGQVLARHAADTADPDGGMTAQLQELAGLCIAWDDVLAPFAVRVKAAAHRLRVVSPQHVEIGQERRLSGIPKRAVRLADGRYTFTQWPGLRVQLRPDRLPGYRTREATVSIGHVPPTGWLGDDGRVWPVELATDDAGSTRIVRPGEHGPERRRLAPVERQHAVLRPYWTGSDASPSRTDQDGQLVTEWDQVPA